MKKIIDGKIYDTETATEIADWSNSYGLSDFKHCSETLYKTTKGAYFVYGEGGANSRWAEPVGNMRGYGDGIQPMNPAEALGWCETHDVDADVIAAEFTDLIEEA